MNRNQTIRLLIGIVVLVVGAALLFVLTDRDNPQVVSSSLQDLLSSDTCSRACWLGIEPGVTDRETAQSILNGAGIEYVDVGLPEPEQNAIYDFSQDENQQIKGVVAISGETVTQVTLIDLNVCVSTVVDQYGEPSMIQEDESIELLYPDQGLIFTVNVENQTQIGSVFLTAPSIFERRASNMEQNWDDLQDKFAANCEG